jgi:hypothetical protein
MRICLLFQLLILHVSSKTFNTQPNIQEFKPSSTILMNSMPSMRLNLRGGKDHKQAGDGKSKKRDSAAADHTNIPASNATAKTEHGMDMKTALKQVCFGLMIAKSPSSILQLPCESI